MTDYYDNVIIGGGIIGLSIAREIIKKEHGSSVLLIEKESKIGLHASGRNSGVLHSGIYYPSGSLKSKVCSSGGKEMADYCHEHSLPIRHIGKVIVPTISSHDERIDLLYNRANKGGINAFIIDERELHEIEPEARSVSGRALYSPDTAVIDPLSILDKIVSELSNITTILTDSIVTTYFPDKSKIVVNGKEVKYGKLYNAAGLYADKIAHMFSAGEDYTILPFKGLYYQLVEDCGVSIKKLIYPVPNLDYPFLGIHSVTMIDGSVLFGPSSIPALGRENYSMIKGINPIDLFSIGYHLYGKYISDGEFRKFTHEEMSKFTKNQFVSSAKSIVPKLHSKCLYKSKKVGIRAQLYNTVNKKLEMDFIIERVGNTVHVLNAISPAFTSAFSMAKIIVGNDHAY